MNAANIDKSERLQRVLDVLNDYREHTTLAIQEGAGVCSVSACVSELRCNDHKISCNRRGNKWFYRLQSNKVVQFPVAA